MDQQPSEQQPKSTIRTIRLVRSTPIQSLESQPVVSASEPTSDPTESPKSTSIVVNTLLQNSGELISSPYVLDYIRLTPSQQVDLERMVKNVQTEFSETLNWAVTKYNANSPEYKASLKDTIEALETSTHNPVAVAIALQRYFESSKEAQEGTVETKNNWKSRWNNITDSISEYAGRIVMSGLLATALFATPAIMRSCEISNEKDRIEAAKQAVIDKVSAEKQAVIDKANAQEREAKAEKEKKETLESRLQKQTLISTTYSSLTTNTTMNPVALKEAYQKVLQDDMIFRIEENQIKGYEVSNGNNVTYVINEDTINKSVMNFCAKLELKGIKYDDGLKIVNALVKASEKSNPTDILEAAGKIADKISEKNITIDKTINSIELVAGDNSPYKTAKYAIMNYISNYPEKNSPVETTTASQPVADTTPKISTYQQILNDTNQTESVRKLLVRRAMIDEVKRYEASGSGINISTDAKDPNYESVLDFCSYLEKNGYTYDQGMTIAKLITSKITDTVTPYAVFIASMHFLDATKDNQIDFTTETNLISRADKKEHPIDVSDSITSIFAKKPNHTHTTLGIQYYNPQPAVPVAVAQPIQKKGTQLEYDEEGLARLRKARIASQRLNESYSTNNVH